MKRRSGCQSGIALFILMTSLLIISLAMRELIFKTNVQVEKVRNSYDRLQAFYLARSNENLARFFLMIDASIDRQLGDAAFDAASEMWGTPIPFPIPVEFIAALNADQAADDAQSAMDQIGMKQCGEFFDDFPGSSFSEIHDLSSRFNLNDLSNRRLRDSFLNLLRPDFEFVSWLQRRNIDPEVIVRQIVDYTDDNDAEEETNAPEIGAYAERSLPYGPKNLPMTTIDELKLIPAMDDELFQYLSPFIQSLHFAGRTKRAKINLNTVSKEVFQAMLKNVSNAEELAEIFIKDREENKTIYTDKTMKENLEKLDITIDNFELSLATGSSEAFEIKTSAQVNNNEIQLISILKKPSTPKDKNPFVQKRINP
jgi:type II secretory pathway component PulK